jgi:hypothetical protein
MAQRARVLSWRPHVSGGALVGYLDIELCSGMVVRDVRVFSSGSKV